MRLPAVLGALSLACVAVHGKVSTTGPKRGWVYSCQAGNPNGGGAFRDGPWIKGAGTFDDRNPNSIAARTVRTYYYAATLDYAYTLGCFHGMPVAR